MPADLHAARRRWHQGGPHRRVSRSATDGERRLLRPRQARRTCHRRRTGLALRNSDQQRPGRRTETRRSLRRPREITRTASRHRSRSRSIPGQRPASKNLHQRKSRRKLTTLSRQPDRHRDTRRRRISRNHRHGLGTKAAISIKKDRRRRTENRIRVSAAPVHIRAVNQRPAALRSNRRLNSTSLNDRTRLRNRRPRQHDHRQSRPAAARQGHRVAHDTSTSAAPPR